MRLKMHPGITHTSSELATHIGMAHFSATGPENTYCSQCSYRAKGGCLKFLELTKDKIRTFPRETLSCKYFTPKELNV